MKVRPTQVKGNTKLRKLIMQQGLLILILLINFFVLFTEAVTYDHKTGLELKQIAAKEGQLLPYTALISTGNGSGQDNPSPCQKMFPDDFDLDEDDLGVIPEWDRIFSTAFTYLFCTPFKKAGLAGTCQNHV